MNHSDIFKAIERLAPLEWQEEYDNAGRQVGEDAETRAVLVCLDVTEAIVDEAISKGCNLIVSHHPLIFRPLKNVCGDNWQQRCIIKALRKGIAIYSAHTNLDNSPYGVNRRIAEKIGLKNLRWLDGTTGTDGKASCGTTGTDGKASCGTTGTDGKTSCGTTGTDGKADTQQENMPAENLFPCIDSTTETACQQLSGHGSGMIGELEEAVSDYEFAARIKKIFNVPDVKHNAQGRMIKTVALCGGAGSFLASDAERHGADCFFTGEISYHNWFDHNGILLIAAGHFESEQFTCDLLCEHLRNEFPELEIKKTGIITNPISNL